MQEEKDDIDELLDRYQYRSWYVRWYRWLRYRPLFFLLGIAAHIEHLELKEGRMFTLKTRLSHYKALAHSKMKYYYTEYEVFEDSKFFKKDTK